MLYSPCRLTVDWQSILDSLPSIEEERFELQDESMENNLNLLKLWWTCIGRPAGSNYLLLESACGSSCVLHWLFSSWINLNNRTFQTLRIYCLKDIQGYHVILGSLADMCHSSASFVKKKTKFKVAESKFLIAMLDNVKELEESPFWFRDEIQLFLWCESDQTINSEEQIEDWNKLLSANWRTCLNRERVSLLGFKSWNLSHSEDHISPTCLISTTKSSSNFPEEFLTYLAKIKLIVAL